MAIGLFAFFMLGLVFGSFFHVVGSRLPKNESLLFPRSHCDVCKHPLTIGDLIPVLSYFHHGGRCKYCHTKLSFFYPLTEIATGILFMVSYYSFGISYELLLALGVCALFMIILVSDLLYLIIPDEVLLFFLVYFSIILFILNGGYGLLSCVINGLFLFILMYSLMRLGNHLFHKESLGGGDIKLMFLVGMILNSPLLSIISLFLASVIALPISLILYLKNKENIIPFGPFLLLGFLILFFMKIDVITLIENLIIIA